MQAIIAATDFSDIAENAVRYACALAAAHNAPLTVVHSFYIPVAFSDSPMPVMPIDEGRDLAEANMDELLQKLAADFPGLSITGKVMYGDVVDSLQEFLEDDNISPSLIVFGNSDSGDNNAIWFGSTALNALKSLPYAVMAIPPAYKYEPVKKICFTCDMTHITGHLPTEQLLALVAETGAELHVLNVGHNNSAAPDAIMESEDLHRYLAPANPQYHYVDSKDIDTAIQHFVDENHMDWLVAIPHKHSFFESLTHKSHVKAMVRMTHIPLIALHDK